MRLEVNRALDRLELGGKGEQKMARRRRALGEKGKNAARRKGKVEKGKKWRAAGALQGGKGKKGKMVRGAGAR